MLCRLRWYDTLMTNGRSRVTNLIYASQRRHIPVRPGECVEIDGVQYRISWKIITFIALVGCHWCCLFIGISSSRCWMIVCQSENIMWMIKREQWFCSVTGGDCDLWRDGQGDARGVQLRWRSLEKVRIVIVSKNPSKVLYASDFVSQTLRILLPCSCPLDAIRVLLL